MKKEQINTIIFDFDGTLADTLNLCYHSLQKVFYVFDNKNFSVKQIKKMFGPTEPNIIKSNLINSKKKKL
ncbi:HAD hydrolase-like protein [Virgibacillus sp. Bac330]|uniref:HAD hydrolase-like protein n=1 Tax=Virgibacillus sp. Bac330 TaxID=2419841 RepID=UPI00352A9225